MFFQIRKLLCFVFVFLPVVVSGAEENPRGNAATSAAKKGSILQPYRTDACTTPAGIGKKSWDECCTAHDFAYWVGGSQKDKMRVDAELVQCLRSKDVGGKVAAKIFELIPDFVTQKHWGNRWVPPREDAPLSEEEIAQVKKYEPSFRLPFPIVRNASGEKCGPQIASVLEAITSIKSLQKILCFDLVQTVTDQVSRQEMVYSDDCVGFFIVTHQGGTAPNKVQGFGACAKWIKPSRKTAEVARVSKCAFSIPPMKGYLELLNQLKFENRLAGSN